MTRNPRARVPRAPRRSSIRTLLGLQYLRLTLPPPRARLPFASQAFKAKAVSGFSVSAGRTIDTDTRRKAMKAKQEAERKKAAAAKEAAKKLAEKNKAAAAKAKAAAAAEKKRKEEARKANKARYNAMNKTVGGSSKLIKKSAPPTSRTPANRKKDDKPRKKFLGISCVRATYVEMERVGCGLCRNAAATLLTDTSHRASVAHSSRPERELVAARLSAGAIRASSPRRLHEIHRLVQPVDASTSIVRAIQRRFSLPLKIERRFAGARAAELTRRLRLNVLLHLHVGARVVVGHYHIGRRRGGDGRGGRRAGDGREASTPRRRVRPAPARAPVPETPETPAALPPPLAPPLAPAVVSSAPPNPPRPAARMGPSPGETPSWSARASRPGNASSSPASAEKTRRE